MRKFLYDLKQICRHNRDGSYATQANRERMLSQMGRQLLELGYGLERAASLKPKHIDALVNLWKSQNLSTGTFKNRMSNLRWLMDKVGKRNTIARSNDHYGIPRRVYVTNVSKARELVEAELALITDPCTWASLRLQAAFGLRREESIKIRPAWADRRDHIRIKASWGKGKRDREVLIRNTEQRVVLEEAKAIARKTSQRSLVGKATYIEQVRRFEHQCECAGICKTHGHRHMYAQVRYRELTGWDCPCQGGPRSKELDATRKQIDYEARMKITTEMGHGREQVVAIYVGR